MAGKRTLIGEVAIKWLSEFPNYPTKTIARLMFEKERPLFRTIEHARKAISVYRGKAGRRTRAMMTYTAHYEAQNKNTSNNWCKLPAPLTDDKPWDIVPVTCRRALIISDAHIPYHDPVLEVAIAEGVRLQADLVLLNGDILDFYSLSFWEKDPRQRNTRDDIEKGRRFLEYLREKFPRARIIYKEGNHEERLWRYAYSHCPDLVGIRDANSEHEILSLASLLDFKEYGVELVADKRPIRIGEHLHAIHGHEFRRPFQNPVNPARGLYLRAKCNAVCGDLHQTSEHTETGITHTVSCWSIGCLCDLHPCYMPLNKWNHGFATMEIHAGTWSLTNRKIINGKVV